MEGHITEDNSDDEEAGEGEGEEGSYWAIRGCGGLWAEEEAMGLNWSGGGVEGGGGFVGKKKERKLLMVDEVAMADLNDDH